MFSGRIDMLFRPLSLSLAACLLAGSAAAQERQWSLDASDQDAYLIFGVPDSDDVGVSLWCPIRQGVVNIFVPEIAGVEPGKTEITAALAADDQSAEVSGKTEQDQDTGISNFEGQIRVDDPIVAAMLKADRFHLKSGGEDMVFPLIEADLGGLVELCRKD